jgi:predicted DNA-binding transcriptional regulator YafY
MQGQPVTIDYINYRGQRALRRIMPEKVFFGVSNWHQGEQWFLLAEDLDKHELREFAMKDILAWKPGVEST